MPSRQQVHIDRALTNISVAYIQDASNFIADRVFPIIPVQKQSDLYFIYRRADFLRDEAAERAAGTESAGGTYNVDKSEPYFCRVVAFHKDVNEEERVNSDDPLSPDKDSTEFVTNKLMIRREVQWASNFFKAGIWGKEIAGIATAPNATQTLFWNLAAADPVQVVKNEATKMMEGTGYKPNTLVMSPYVKDALLEHPDIIDRIKYTQKGIASIDLLAELFEVKNVYIAQAIYNSAADGETEATGFIMGKHALLCYSEPKPGLKKPSAGYIFAWKGLKGAGAFGNRIVRIPMPWLGMDTERIEGEMAYDMRKVAADLGTFFTSIVQ
jgi:hypothetical protein